MRKREGWQRASCRSSLPMAPAVSLERQTGIADSDPQAVFLNAGKALSPGLNPYPEQFQSF